MRLVIVDDGRLGLLRGDRVVDVTQALRERGFAAPGVDLPELIREWEMLAPALAALEQREPARPLAACRLQAPVTRPGKIVCFPSARGRGGSDAVARAAWAGRAYLKAPSALVGPRATVRLPPRPVDYEVALAIVVGPRSPTAAADPRVFGCTAAIDLLARGWEERSLRGSRDGFLAVGPALVHDQATFSGIGR